MALALRRMTADEFLTLPRQPNVPGLAIDATALFDR
jgi:hypothetical protein